MSNNDARRAGAQTAHELIAALVGAGMSADRIEAAAEDVLGARHDHPTAASEAFFAAFDHTAAMYIADCANSKPGDSHATPQPPPRRKARHMTEHSAAAAAGRLHIADVARTAGLRLSDRAHRDSKAAPSCRPRSPISGPRCRAKQQPRQRRMRLKLRLGGQHSNDRN